MDPDTVAPMIAFMTLCFSVAGVLVLRPLSKRVAELLAAMAQERRGGGNSQNELAQIRLTLESVNARMALLEDRLDFTERLMTSGPASKEPLDLTAGRR
ncbi:MAG TPA: hypothetical protein VK864_08595 [Longimicrobiales bacterium]|nr:hypothetical protein [Longimicrobiales bacterium]